MTCASRMPLLISSHPTTYHLILKRVLELHDAPMGLQHLHAGHLLADVLCLQIGLQCAQGKGAARESQQGKERVEASGLRVGLKLSAVSFMLATS